MESYFKFFRVFPRLVCGGVFLLSAFYLVAGPTTRSLIHEVIYNNKCQSSALSGLYISALLFVLSAFGVFLLEKVLLLLGNLIIVIAWRHLFIGAIQRCRLTLIFCPVELLIVQYIANNKTQLIDYYKLKSKSNVPDIGQDDLDNYFEKVSLYVSALHAYSDIFDYTFAASITQEQELLARLKNNIVDLWMFFASLLVFIGALSSLKYIEITLIDFAFIACSSLLLLLPLVAQGRSRYARHVAITSLDVFTLGVGATVADRESTIG